MKKVIAVVLCVMFMILLAGCGSDEPYDVVGKTFVYEGEGFGGDFTISITHDGSFTAYEGFLSSFIAIGEWKTAGNMITLTYEVPTEDGKRAIVNVFEIREGKLIWKAEGSDNFSHIKVKDGEAFNEQ